MKSKFFNFALMFCLMIPCIFVFAGCGPTASFTANEDVKTSTQTIINDIATNIYNNTAVYGTSTSYSVAQIKGKDTDFNYYVKIGSVANFDSVDSLTINGSTFTKTQSFELSIGKNNKINDKCFYVTDNNLFVAAPIIAFETVNASKIKVNDVEFDFNLNTTAEVGTITSVAFEDNTNSCIVEQGAYDLTFNNANKYLKFYYADATANDVILTKKVLSNSQNTNKNGVVNYGLTKTENLGANDTPLGYYPIGWSNSLTAQHVTDYDGATMNYSFYVNGKVYSATLNYDINIA